MRDTSPAKFEPTLRNCLIDSDPEAARIETARRRRSMMLSSLIQAALLTAAIVAPLFASQAIPYERFRLIPGPIIAPTPTPPGHGKPRGNQAAHSGPRDSRPVVTIWQPRVPDRVLVVDDRNGAGPQLTLGNPTFPGIGVEGGIDLPLAGGGNYVPPPTPETDSRPRGPVRVSPPVQEAKLIHRVKPAYPPLALQIRKEGRVELHAIIATDGTMRELKVITGDALFIQSALDAVQQWRYQPTLLGSEPVEVQTRITVIFVLNR